MDYVITSQVKKIHKSIRSEIFFVIQEGGGIPIQI